MDSLMQLLSGLFRDPQQFSWVFAAVMGTAVALLALGFLSVALGLSDPLRRRLRAVAGAESPRRRTSGDTVAEFIAPLSGYILPQKDWERSQTTTKLVHAGYRSPTALTLFYGLKSLGGFVLPGMAVAAALLFVHGLSSIQLLFLALTVSMLGLRLPNMLLERQIKKRQRQIHNGFPDVLDLLITCTEAGLGLNAALKRVADECAVSHPVLSQELTLVNMEIRAGVERLEALRNLAARAGLDDIRSFVSFLSQSLRFGTSMADTLRLHAEEFRDKRMQRAEEMAAKVGTKMIFPLIFCILPSFFLVAIGPAILGVLKAFGAR